MNVPTGTIQVYSNVGTKVYDHNMQVIFTYDTANIGMAATDALFMNGKAAHSVVIGDDFQNIFSFRGSSVKYILNLEKDFKNL